MAKDELKVGEVVARRDLHARFGGTPQGGISPSTQARMVMAFVAERPTPDDFTGWGDDGIFHFSGVGMHGDQEMTRGNLALLRHKEQGRAVHLFHQLRRSSDELGRLYRHLGRFEVDSEQPYYIADAPDANGQMRTVIVFRLRPVGATVPDGPRLPVTPLTETRITKAPEITVARVRRRPQESTNDILRRLTLDYASHLHGLGREVVSAQVRVKGETRIARVDLLDATENRLIEVKHNTTRQSVRSAIGALMDYRRFFHPTPTLTLLVPAEPREDLLDLCASLCVEVVWPNPEGGFTSTHD
ncbi:restriction endonuclease [Streptomyces sp. MST-110588]|uniref:restriction endonuclease n=1 Tax=Streptomyces sp. MST-110588 TaxID=2833628 RepID=UPI001F5C6948|nr:restriction endonuclease [Streptomyces sp. MST-110588]UNO42139.1 restriction endonuclease [Streptomyces sp. MST-110588]